MSVDHLPHLRSELKHVFEDYKMPESWDEEWIFISVEDAEAELPGVFADLRGDESRVPQECFEADAPMGRTRSPLNDTRVPWLGGVIAVPVLRERHPGTAVPYSDQAPYPPPDALAFYLPFHYYYPDWWGVYLTLEGTQQLADLLARLCQYPVAAHHCQLAAQTFLYGHEAYHHKVESFATRLEITHHKALYKKGFETLYRRHLNTDECIEEALATAHGFDRVRQTFKDKERERDLLLVALKTYIRNCPPGYRQALQIIEDKSFMAKQHAFAEANQQEALHTEPKESALWNLFPHAFTGIANVKSRTNYLVRRDSSLGERVSMGRQFVSYRDLERKLRKLLNCEPVDQRGSHQKWRNPEGATFPVPRHPGDIKDGTLRKILKQAGSSMTVSQFVSAKA